jgi:uncharacterized protein YkwD
MGVGVANQWRADLGAPPLAASSSKFSAACSYATYLAKNKLFQHDPTAGGEVLYRASGGSCSDAWGAWKNSAPHYTAITTSWLTTAGFACVIDSGGALWAVGRLG